jgi:hypothetical protein
VFVVDKMSKRILKVDKDDIVRSAIDTIKIESLNCNVSLPILITKWLRISKFFICSETIESNTTTLKIREKNNEIF